MLNLVCIGHPRYRGKNPPELSCKVCCAIYIYEIKRHQALSRQGNFDSDALVNQNAARDQELSREEVSGKVLKARIT